MRVSPEKPLEVVYTLFSHEYLGILFESFVVQLDEKGRYSLAYQNISSKNSKEFEGVLDVTDFELIKLMDNMQQESIIKKFNTKNLKPLDFLQKIYGEQNSSAASKEVHRQIEFRLENYRAKILKKLGGKRLFEMGNDGNPIWKEITIMPEKASVLFHFRRNEENTHYFPTLKYRGEKLEWQYRGGYLICKEPAWLVVDNNLYNFEKDVDGKKLMPFLNKKFIVVPRKVEKTYYEKFVTQLVASFDVYAKGFDIKVERCKPEPLLNLSVLPSNNGSLDLFQTDQQPEEEDQIVFDLKFKYGQYSFRSDQKFTNNVELEQSDGEYVFHKVIRNLDEEKSYGEYLEGLGLSVRSSKVAMDKTKAFDWINLNREVLEEKGITILQGGNGSGKRYFLGKASISVGVRENMDWFDVDAIIEFGDFRIPFSKIRKLLLQGKTDFELPNGEIATIPKSWFINYSEIFAFLEAEKSSSESMVLKKHHIALASELQKENLIKMTLTDRLEKLRDFTNIQAYDLPQNFFGTLRPYQKAGYDWLRFLQEYQLGGCLADDMGLGKTVQTLAMLAQQKESSGQATSLLIMPTSLIYNWELEAKKFTPDLRILVYTGAQRVKDSSQFQEYDLILTSYGITRLDIDVLKSFHFNYVILDESQAIKNPNSIITKAVNSLSCLHRLTLTGTPVENGTLDLWSQLNFINKGLLGSQSTFKKQFLQPIEKKNDMEKARKLYGMIKPFILRRLKTQVATDLPEKVVQVKYATMTPEQEERYEEVKSYYREKIIQDFDEEGRKKQQFTLLRGLTELRQIANHPKLTEASYEGDSGKLEDIMHMVRSTVSEGHKVLIFSQFVRHLGIVKEFLREENIRFSYLDGATANRQAEVEAFQKDKGIKVFLISLKAGGVGLNLTAADYVFLLDPWWNPAVEAQAIDRAHRIGRENKVIIYKFITRNTVEEKIMLLQSRKMALAGELIGTDESFMKNLSKDDISALLD
jgi:SNF2 family DNA or RNA helicase